LGWEDWYKDSEIPAETGLLEGLLLIIFFPVILIGMFIFWVVGMIICKLALFIIEIKEMIDKKNQKLDPPIHSK
jgi:hypothetical protein